MVQVRAAVASDLPQIREIYTHYVLNTVVSFLILEPPEDYATSRFRNAQARHLPYLVASENDEPDSKVIGYAYASAFRGFMLGYAHSVEISVFCHPEHRARGIGSALLGRLLEGLKTTKHLSSEAGHDDQAEEVQVRQVLAVMGVDDQAADEGLGLRDWYVNKWGFEQVGRLKGIGRKNGRM